MASDTPEKLFTVNGYTPDQWIAWCSRLLRMRSSILLGDNGGGIGMGSVSRPMWPTPICCFSMLKPLKRSIKSNGNCYSIRCLTVRKPASWTNCTGMRLRNGKRLNCARLVSLASIGHINRLCASSDGHSDDSAVGSIRQTASQPSGRRFWRGYRSLCFLSDRANASRQDDSWLRHRGSPTGIM